MGDTMKRDEIDDGDGLVPDPENDDFDYGRDVLGVPAAEDLGPDDVEEDDDAEVDDEDEDYDYDPDFSDEPNDDDDAGESCDVDD